VRPLMLPNCGNGRRDATDPGPGSGALGSQFTERFVPCGPVYPISTTSHGSSCWIFAFQSYAFTCGASGFHALKVRNGLNTGSSAPAGKPLSSVTSGVTESVA